MTAEAGRRLLETVDALRVWQRGGQRAPHKPLLILLMLGRVRHGERRLVPFTEIEQDLRELLTDFGPPRRTRPEYPFWHLQSDGVWDLPAAAALDRKPGETPPLAVARTLEGGFPLEIWQRLRADDRMIGEVAQRLLAAHFPASLHADILDRVGLGDLDEPPTRRAQRRDPRFRLEVLRAYGYRCAVCGYNGRLENIPVGLDAAHVRWWAAGGPDDLTNAMAMCVLHHRAFDLGAIGVTADRRVKVAQAFNGGQAAHLFVGRFAGSRLHLPHSGGPAVDERHRRWHDNEVFRGPAQGLDVLAAEPPDAPYHTP